MALMGWLEPTVVGSDMPYPFRPRLNGREDRAGAWHSRDGYRITLKTRSVAPSSRMVAVTVPWAVL